MIARNDGTKLSSLTNDSPRDRGGNERGSTARERVEEEEKGMAASSGQIAWKTTLRYAGFLLIGSRFLFGSPTISYHHVPKSKRRPRTEFRFYKNLFSALPADPFVVGNSRWPDRNPAVHRHSRAKIVELPLCLRRSSSSFRDEICENIARISTQRECRVQKRCAII